MVVSWEEGRMVNIAKDGQVVEQVKTLNYIGLITTTNETCIEAMKSRIGMAKLSFNKEENR
jgi:hypothetical protein